MAMTVILRGIVPDEWILGIRAAKALLARPESKDAIIAYGDGETRDFYVKRNKSSITVRSCSRSETPDIEK